ncbi:hypothetical protein QBC47DRAFT_371048 [Echria macrotheca]|uniref:Vacuolar protein sorting-associated protein 62 n=1 Tax=Echria macrotheca TaxID=438768 RepID=A0AAJ0FD81_9PEZI|nr:hypothetical protein QBC47DRAFT_371048 [Echria macrotheca]
MPSLGPVLLHLLCLSTAAARPSRRLLERQTRSLPDYAISYAPYTYLASTESWFPSDVTTHLQNTIPEVNGAPIGSVGSATLANLNGFGTNMSLTAPNMAIKPSNQPAWLTSEYGKPSGGLSAAPATLVAVQKNATTVDVFYFFFYSYNYGGNVLQFLNFDDHVGDWEHVMIRFVDSKPYAVYLSQHGAGSAYFYSVLEKNGQRPVTYVAHGGHANYATAGTQEYTIAAGLITDTTDKGFAWDPALNYRGYWYDPASKTFTSAGGAGTGGAEQATETATWLNWLGQWGDAQYPNGQNGQYCLFSECHYAAGPTGPVDKNLGRAAVCENESKCTIFNNIDDLTEQTKRRREAVMCGSGVDECAALVHLLAEKAEQGEDEYTVEL